MRLPVSRLLFAPLTLALAFPFETSDAEISKVPSVAESAVLARKLLLSEKIATLSTIFPKNDPHGLGGQPIGLMDYYADCSDDGNPTLLAIGIATSFKNVKSGSPISLSIREHPTSDFTSPASLPRLSLIGHLTPIPSNSLEAIRLARCFVSRHLDAKWWLPGNIVHSSEWVRFEVETIYWVGGFGNVAYIGFIPKDVYENVTLSDEDKEEALKGKNEEKPLKTQHGWRSKFFLGK